MIFTTRDLDILRLLRWCRFVQADDLYGAFSKTEIHNLFLLQLLRYYAQGNAFVLTADGHSLLNTAFRDLPTATPPAYKPTDTLRRIRQAKIMLTAYAAGIHVFQLNVAELQLQPSFFLPSLQRNRGSNPWGSTRVAALLHMGDLLCAVHWVCPQIGCIALNDELTAFYNHTVAVSAKQRTMIFTANSYAEILAELAAEQRTQSSSR